MKSRANVSVKDNASEAVVSQAVSDNHIAGDAAGSGAIGKHADTRASDLNAVVSRKIFGDGIAINAVVRSKRRRGLSRRRMGSENDAAFEWIVLHDVVNKQIALALGGLVTNQDAIG